MNVNFATDLQPFRELNDRERELLIERITDDEGARFVTVWADAPKPNTVLDGHHTLKECTRLGIKPTFVKRKFETRQEARAFSIRAQLGRRNLDPAQYAYWLAELTKETRRPVGQPKNSANLAPFSELAEEAGVSIRTMKRAAKVADRGAESVKRLVANGKAAISDAAAIADLPKAQQTKAAAKAERDGTTLRRAVSGGTAFNPAELNGAPSRKRKSGSSITPGKDRALAQKYLSELCRIFKRLEIFDEFDASLSQMLRRVKTL